MRRFIGRYLLGYGLLHLAAGVALYAGPLRAIVTDGGWNAVDPHVDRGGAFWYVVTGLMVLLLGALVDWLEAQGLTPPRRLGWGILGLLTVGGFCMPLSGFWLFAPAAVAVLRRSAPHQSPRPGGRERWSAPA